MTWKILTAQIRKEIYYLLISRGLFPKEQKDNTRKWEEQEMYYTLIHASPTKSKWNDKSSFGVDWLQKGIWYDHTKLDNRLSQNIQDLWQSQNIYWEYNGKLESGTNRKRKKISWGENPGKIKMLKEQETYKYLGIMEADTIKHVEMKKKKEKKKTSGEQENSKPNDTVEISSKG